MKKIILLFFLNVILFQAFAQSLELYYEDELLGLEEAVTFTAHADSGLMSFHGLEVTNNSNNPLNIKCAREVFSAVNNTENSFCWGVCYSTSTDTSTVSIKINSGETSNEFIGDYFPGGNAGITSVKYIFYDVANPDDQTTFIVNYKATTESAVENNLQTVEFSRAYPNPANEEVSINYEFTENQRNVKFVIYNLFGHAVNETSIRDYSGTMKVNTSNLTEGIYFYSILINNEPTRTQKLIIKH